MVFLLMSCADVERVELIDRGELVSWIDFEHAHLFLAEYEREICLDPNAFLTQTIEYPIDVGGDFPIYAYRHKDSEHDYLRFKSGLYHLLFDLDTHDYAQGHQPIEGKLFESNIDVSTLPPIVVSWKISKSLAIEVFKP